ncbi:MAG TPA: TldD/PmbA family protein [Thermoanaerobaculia bacterium]|nr:TldD/PmbA family protein [Thermoanaerobaculia bacterium]
MSPVQDALLPLEEILSRLERILAGSPADATELAWLEVRRGRETNGRYRRDTFQYRERTILVRVQESGRIGYHRTEAADLSDLENALRVALAQARLAPPVAAELRPRLANGPQGGEALPSASLPALFDPEVARLTQARAKEMVQGWAERNEQVRIGWAEGRAVVVNSRGLRRAAEATAVSIEARCGRGPGAGQAASASRHLATLAPQGTIERARRRQAPQSLGVEGPPSYSVPTVLSQEAVASLLDLLNRYALSADAFLQGTSLLRGNLGNPVFHRAVSLRDDPTDPRGLPFPFDIMGWATRPVDLIEEGVLLTPAVDERLACEIGRPPTPHRIGPDESMATHLFLRSGPLSEAELVRVAGDGIWIGGLEPIECFDAQALRFRAVARGVRRVAGGLLGRALPDLVWEDNLGSVLARVRAVGGEPVVIATREGFLGATTTPALAVAASEEVAELRPLRE